MAQEKLLHEQVINPGTLPSQSFEMAKPATSGGQEVVIHVLGAHAAGVLAKAARLRELSWNFRRAAFHTSGSNLVQKARYTDRVNYRIW